MILTGKEDLRVILAGEGVREDNRIVRKFYAMTPEDAYAILEAIAEISGYTHRLKK